MKTKTIISIAVLIIWGSCKKQETHTILSGILPEAKNTSITLIPIDEYFPGLTSAEVHLTAKTDSLGRFKFSFSTSIPKFYQIIDNNYHQLKADLYIEPGDSLFVEQSSWADTPKFVISGKGSEKLNHLKKDYSIFPKDNLFYQKIKSNQFATELDFKNFIDSIHLRRVNALNTAEFTPEIVKKHFLNTLNAERLKFLLEHLERRNYYMIEELDYFFPEERYLGFLDSIDFSEDFAKTTVAKLLSNTYLTYKSRYAYRNKTEKEFWDEKAIWVFSFLSNQPKSLWTDKLVLGSIYEYGFGMMNNSFFNELELFENKAKKLFTSNTNQKLFEANIVPYKNLAPGKPAPDFELPDSNGVLHKLSDFKGKIVYIDFWGTWCNPCLQNIPDALKLHEIYKDEPVVFLYVALEYDSSHIAYWKEFISGKSKISVDFLNNKPFPGVHLVAEKQFGNESIKPYKIGYVPTYSLIDSDGNFVKSKAKGSNEIQLEIDELIKKMKQ